MYCENDTVFYRSSGICTVAGIDKKNFYGKTTEYYVLHPLGDPISTFFVPTGKEKGTLRPILTKQEADSVLHAPAENPCPWNGNENLRRTQHRKIISDGVPLELASLIRAICSYETQQKAGGKKLHAVDEALLRDAQKLFCSEFSYVLGIDTDEVLPLLLKG